MKHKSILFTVAFASLAVGFAACSEQENGVENKTVPAEKITVPAAQNGVPAAQNGVPADSPIEWLEKMEPAFEKAKAEGKMVLVEFTGSDWCPPCRFLRGEVFPSKSFIDYAKDKFVFVELDFPHSKPQTEKTRQYNHAKSELYKVSGFPTLLIFDAQTEKPVASIVGGGGTPEAYLKRFSGEYEKAKKLTDDLVAAQKEADGVKRAAMLYEIYKTIDAELKPFYRETLEEQILKSDPKDPFGITGKRAERQRFEKQFGDFETFMDFVKKTYVPASQKNSREAFVEASKVVLAKVEPILKDNEMLPAIRQLYLYHVLVPAYASMQEIDKLIAVCREIIAIDPESKEGKNATSLIDNYNRYRAEEAKKATESVPAAK